MLASRIPILIAVALLGAAAAIACGDDGGDGADSAEAYARAFCEAFGAHVDGFEEIVSLGDEIAAADQNDAEAVLGTLEEGVEVGEATFRGLADDLGAIDPPEGISEQHEQLVTTFEDGADAFAGLQGISDLPLDEALAELTTVEEELNNLGLAFDTIGDPPAEFDEAFESEEACTELEDDLQF
jgi:hypothetical protein